MDQSRTIPSLPTGNGGGGGGGGNGGPGSHRSRLYTTDFTSTDTKRDARDASASTNASSYEVSEKAWGLNDPPINRPSPPPSASLPYSAAAFPPRKIITEKDRWVPLTLRARVAVVMVFLMLGVAAGIEVAYAFSYEMNGYSVTPLSNFGSPQFYGSFLPVLAVLPIVLYVLTVNHEVYRLQPYISASHGNAPPQQTVLVSYINQNRIYAALDALKNGHRMIVVTTILTYVTTLWQPLAATLFVVRQTNYIVDNFTPIVVTAKLGVNPAFIDLDAVLAAAGYAEAAVVHGLDDPPFVRGGWAVATFDFPSQPKNATMALDAEAVFIDPHCETLTPQLTKLAEGLYNVSATRGNCVYGFSANQTEANTAFGVSKLDNCSETANLEDPFKPVVFWHFTFDGPTASMVHCLPSIETHLVNVNVSLSTRLIISEPTKLKQLTTSNVTVGAPFNGLAPNGIFFPPPPDRFVDARGISVRSAIPNAIHKDADSNPRGMASSLRDISGQLNRVKKVYTQYLAITAKSNFFVPESSTVKPVVETWVPRFWVNRFATHVLAILLISTAICMASLQYVHRKDRSRLYLAGPPGSIASDVSMTSSAKFGLLLNAGDTEKDLERKLQGMRFGIEHSTGQIIVEREDGSSLARYVEEERRRAKESMGSHEDIRLSLLSNEKGPGPVHRDTFVGLRTQNRESRVQTGWRQSAVGSIAPSLGSPLPSATFSQTKFSPLLSPPPLNVVHSPTPTGPSTFAVPSPTPTGTSTFAVLSPTPTGPSTFPSPPSSSTAPRFPTTKYSAPPGPPPQPNDSNSLHDPPAPNPA